MDPVTVILTALAAGAGAGLNEVAETAAADAYAKLKQYLSARFSRAADAVPALEAAPESAEPQAAVRDALAAAHAEEDAQARSLADDVLREIGRDAALRDAVAAIQIVGVEAGGSLRIEEVIAAGPAVHIKDTHVRDDIVIGRVESGRRR